MTKDTDDPYPEVSTPSVEACPECGKVGPPGMHFTGMDYGCAAPVARVEDTGRSRPNTLLEVSGGVGNGPGDEVHLLMRDGRDDDPYDISLVQGWFRVDDLERAIAAASPRAFRFRTTRANQRAALVVYNKALRRMGRKP